MQILEILIIIFLFLLSIQVFLPSTIGKQKKGTVMGIVSVIGVVSFLLHTLLEGLHWQMIPVYIPALILFTWGVYKLVIIYRIQTGAIPEPEISSPRKKLGVVILILTIILVGSTLLLDSILPVFQLPQPSGEYSIGTVTFELTDYTRNETFT